MTMQTLVSQQVGSEYVISIHLDTSKLVRERPDPLYVALYRFPLQGEDLEGEAWRTSILDQAMERAERDLDELTRSIAVQEVVAIPPPDPIPIPDPVDDPIIGDLEAVNEMYANVDTGGQSALDEIIAISIVREQLWIQRLGGG
jgi:hypothetical protein